MKRLGVFLCAMTLAVSAFGAKPLNKDFLIKACIEDIPNIDCISKYGFNDDIDNAATYEAVWNGGGEYTGFNATAAETIEVFSDNAADAGTLVSSGTVTGGSQTVLIDSSATFVTDTVAVGDIALDDTQFIHGIVTAVTSETVLTVARFKSSGKANGVPAIGDAYRVVTSASTGAAVTGLYYLLDGDLANETYEYIVMNGTTAVDTVGAYRRNSRQRVLLAGSGGTNAGAITARQKTTTANVFMKVPAAFGGTMIAAYTMPMDMIGYIRTWFAGLAGKTVANCIIRLRIRDVGEVLDVKELTSLLGGGTSYIQRTYELLKVPPILPGSDIEIQASCDSPDTGVAAGFDLIRFAN